MSKPAKAQIQPEEAIVAYKRILQDVLNQRPSGTRQRLADALGKNRSFVTQMTSPTYPTPIPHRHLATVLAVCHFTPEVRDAFMAAYRLAHPKRFELGESRNARHLNLLVPDFGDDKRNAAFDKAVIEFVQKMAGLVGERGGDD
ncbi:MAG TPA: hypothetical protein VIN06_18565 [Devosia sp.]